MKPTFKPSASYGSPALSIVPKADQLEIFKGFSAAEFEKILTHCFHQTFLPGEALFQEGAPLKNIFFIQTGHVKFCKKETGDKEITFSLFGEGDVFELLMSDKPENHLFSAYALCETTALKVSTADFKKYFMGNTSFANRILYQKIRTIKHLHFSRLVSAQSVEIRMAYLILDILQHPGMSHTEGKTIQLNIALTRRDIAEIVNTSVETSIRVIRKWIKRGLVTMTHRHLIIQDVPNFKRIIGKFPRLPDQ